MRIIGGKLKGIKLVGLSGVSIRPTLDRVRESLFNQLAPDMEGAVFLDLFAGTGAIGIEAISRDAEKVVFVESSAKAQKIIYQNLDKCKLFDISDPNKKKQWLLIKNSASQAIKILQEREYQFDLVYVDPPFAGGWYEDTMVELAKSTLLKTTSIVIVEHHHKTILLESYGRLFLIKSRKLGDSNLSFFSIS